MLVTKTFVATEVHTLEVTIQYDDETQDGRELAQTALEYIDEHWAISDLGHSNLQVGLSDGSEPDNPNTFLTAEEILRAASNVDDEDDPNKPFLEHQGVTVWTCVDDDDMEANFHYTTNLGNANTDNPEPYEDTQFDVRDIPLAEGMTPANTWTTTKSEYGSISSEDTAGREAHAAIIRYAIDRGWLTQDGLKEDEEPAWVDRHSVNCIICGRLFDERYSLGTTADGGDVCPDHPRHPKLLKDEGETCKVIVEYDLNYWGGDYDDVGDDVTIEVFDPDDHIEVDIAFKAQTGINPVHIITWHEAEDEDEGEDEEEDTNAE
ncbi:MAG: hypothetical protein HS126_18845 [Anaerolineales bacterium]|nr:hypothetical protein [Anaerolineales bacterium]